MYTIDRHPVFCYCKTMKLVNHLVYRLIQALGFQTRDLSDSFGELAEIDGAILEHC